MKQFFKEPTIIVMSLCVLLIGFVKTYDIGYFNALQNTRTEAIEAGAAKYVLISSDGTVEFQWINQKEDK